MSAKIEPSNGRFTRVWGTIVDNVFNSDIIVAVCPIDESEMTQTCFPKKQICNSICEPCIDQCGCLRGCLVLLFVGDNYASNLPNLFRNCTIQQRCWPRRIGSYLLPPSPKIWSVQRILIELGCRPAFANIHVAPENQFACHTYAEEAQRSKDLFPCALGSL